MSNALFKPQTIHNKPRALRIVLAVLATWAVAAAASWVWLNPIGGLVGSKPASAKLPDAATLARLDLTQEKAILEATSTWGMQRNGMAPAPQVAASATVEKKIIWNVAATVVRPKERYLLIIDQTSKAITQVKEGEKLPDGSKLLEVTLNTYSVRTESGKKRTLETSFN
jgi:hypothetical protein